MGGKVIPTTDLGVAAGPPRCALREAAGLYGRGSPGLD